MRIATAFLIWMFIIGPAVADESSDDKYIMNFDLRTKTVDGGDGYGVQLKGVQLLDGKALHGDDLTEYEYFFTVSDVNAGKGKLSIEIYEYETRRKTSDVVSEIVSEIEFAFGEPRRFQSENGRFGVDLAFSINRL